MHCPYCGKQIAETARVCGYCGRHLGRSTPPPSAPPVQPTQIIVQTTRSEGLFSGLVGIFNFAMAALVIGLIIFIILMYTCVIRLPTRFPVVNLPSQLDILWTRAVSMQGQVCGGSSPGGTTPQYQPPVEQPAPPQPKPVQPDPVQPAPVTPPCSSGLDEADCKAAGGNPTMMCDMKEGCHTICFCQK
jgi:hypothetical protein